MVPQQFHRQSDEVVEIHRLVSAQGVLVGEVDPGRLVLGFVLGLLQGQFGGHQGVLPQGNPPLDAANFRLVGGLDDLAGDVHGVRRVQHRKASARIMSLRDGTSKMSKSDPSDYSRIHLLDDADTIALKIRKAKTDPHPLAGTVESMENRPEALNLLGIYADLSDSTLEAACKEFEELPFSSLKQKLTDQIVAEISPIGERMKDLLKDPSTLDAILRKGADKARELAAQNMSEIKEIVGFLNT